MQNAGCIMSINHTKSAPIYDVSHYGAVIDYTKVIPRSSKRLRPAMPNNQ